MSVHTRAAPNGCQADIDIPEVEDLSELTYRRKVKILVFGQERKAVVDLIVAACWGGPERAFDVYDRQHRLYHVNIKLVWQEPDGSWEESRDVGEATEDDFLKWRSEFRGDTPPTPMP